MTFDVANKIAYVWGCYLEHCHARLQTLFIPRIPESLLPYPKRVIEEALNIVAKHYHDTGDFEKSKVFQTTIATLLFYGDDEEAIENAVVNFSSPKSREITISNIKRLQEYSMKAQT